MVYLIRMLFDSYCRKKYSVVGCDKQEVIKKIKNNYLKEPKFLSIIKKMKKELN